MKRAFLILIVILMFIMWGYPASASDLPYIHELSLFLSGQKISPSGLIFRHVNDNHYVFFKKQMSVYRTNYRKMQIMPLQKWQKEWDPGADMDLCFYPFAGPDFINAYLVYPGAKTYILVGLEKGGGVPSLSRMSKTNIHKGMDMLVQGFRIFMKLNFYRTLGMQVDLDKSPFTGTVPHILAQMGMLDLVPVAAYKVVMNSSGMLSYSVLKEGDYSDSTAIDFRNSNGEMKRVVYLQLDLSDGSLVNHENWAVWLKNIGPCVGIMKAASYLLHMHGFEIMRNVVLSNMQVIVQDDSGIPYRLIKSKYDITLFGDYNAPNSVFPTRIQQDLIEAHKSLKKHPLDFQFSYNMKGGLRNLMVAKRKK